jgi:fumarylpyruvate hydrolase
VPDIHQAAITLSVNGVSRQASTIAQLIWNIAETIEQLSNAWELQAGDLIFTGTPAGVGAVVASDVMQGDVTGLSGIRVAVTAA